MSTAGAPPADSHAQRRAGAGVASVRVARRGERAGRGTDHVVVLGDPRRRTPTAVSCASESLCVAVNHEGAALITANPMSATPSWSPALNSGQPLNAVSCAPGGLCVAVDSAGRAWVIGHASPSSLPGAGVLTGVSCPSTALCVAVDEEGHVFTTTNPSGGSWTLSGSHPGHLRAVSCASTELCVAVDSAGYVLSTTTPTGPWSEQKLDSEELVAVSCSAAARVSLSITAATRSQARIPAPLRRRGASRRSMANI